MAPTPNPTPTDLKLRVLAIRSRLPKDVAQLVIQKLPEYDTAKGSKKIHNVLNGASSDLAVTEVLESLVQLQAA
ncbi:hypothetical protein HHL22_20770 [Hymenobacter sp. RP-2-7]|uniref:Uncharacterized protein n=1 Tax=Hymenobacter polaris TaxID=2682546 RepID=A0A7Y0AHX5_9BACT|nr:hypothetical protein [Hymenobacter polaris]NML67642.1 hypothetical protein [Hymenobacter polaris]